MCVRVHLPPSNEGSRHLSSSTLLQAQLPLILSGGQHGFWEDEIHRRRALACFRAWTEQGASCKLQRELLIPLVQLL